jgi:hypothetical protein
LPAAFVVVDALAPVVVAAVKLFASVDVVAAVIAPAPRPGPLATGAVVTVDKVVEEVALPLTEEVWLVGLELALVDPEADEEDELDPELEELPSNLMLCQDPDISP